MVIAVRCRVERSCVRLDRQITDFRALLKPSGFARSLHFSQERKLPQAGAVDIGDN